VQLCLEERKAVDRELIILSNEFYTLVPQSEFVNSSVKPIDNEERLGRYMSQLLALLEFQFTIKLLLGAQLRIAEMHPIEYCYRGLGIRLQTLEKESDELRFLLEYVRRSNSTVRIKHIFKLARAGEEERFEPYLKLPAHERLLLWHGSAVANYAGILSQGLRVAPPEAPVTGYMFGKGIYFADMFSKSYGYCAEYGAGLSAMNLMLLSEVVVGKMNELKQPEYMEKPPAGKDSTKGCGSNVPNPKKAVVTAEGYTIPAGETLTSTDSGHLFYNEFIVYNSSQVKLRYLVQIREGHEEEED